jgi:hypothetical protein
MKDILFLLKLLTASCDIETSTDIGIMSSYQDNWSL